MCKKNVDVLGWAHSFLLRSDDRRTVIHYTLKITDILMFSADKNYYNWSLITFWGKNSERVAQINEFFQFCFKSIEGIYGGIHSFSYKSIDKRFWVRTLTHCYS